MQNSMKGLALGLSLLSGAAFGLSAVGLGAVGPAAAADLKIGMITTLSGGGSGLGIDVRDGFLLATKGSNALEVVIEDDQRKPDIAVQLADKMIQSEKVDVMTGIIWSNLDMAVVPAATAQDRKSTRLNSSHVKRSRMPSSA